MDTKKDSEETSQTECKYVSEDYAQFIQVHRRTLYHVGK